jgi:hypothetical protein
MAPHVLVEDVSIMSIEAAKVAYETTDLRERCAAITATPIRHFAAGTISG